MRKSAMISSWNIYQMSVRCRSHTEVVMTRVPTLGKWPEYKAFSCISGLGHGKFVAKCTMRGRCTVREAEQHLRCLEAHPPSHSLFSLSFSLLATMGWAAHTYPMLLAMILFNAQSIEYLERVYLLILLWFWGSFQKFEISSPQDGERRVFLPIMTCSQFVLEKLVK